MMDNIFNKIMEEVVDLTRPRKPPVDPRERLRPQSATPESRPYLPLAEYLPDPDPPVQRAIEVQKPSFGNPFIIEQLARDLKEDDFDNGNPYFDQVPVSETTANDRFWMAVCREYLNSSPDVCERIRSSKPRIVANHPGRELSPFRFARRAATRFDSVDALDWLDLGLAALSISASSFDFRDELSLLGQLRFHALLLNIDPEPHFQKVAALSGTDERFVNMRATLEQFKDHPLWHEILSSPTAAAQLAAIYPDGMPYL